MENKDEKVRIKQERIKALIVGGVIGLIIILIGILILVIFKKEDDSESELFVREKTQVAVFVAPESAEVKIDDEAYLNGIYEISSGAHTVKITAMGYEPRVYNIEVKPDRITLLYDYLDKSSDEELTDKDVDMLRYLANDDETVKKIEEFMAELPEDYVFLSSAGNLVRNFESLRNYYGEVLNEYSYRLIKETLDAYFYFARKGTRNLKIVENSLNKIDFREGEYLATGEFRVLADLKEEYRVRLNISRSQAEPEKAYEIWRVTILTEAGTALFQYNGRFSRDDYGSAEDFDEGVDFD